MLRSLAQSETTKLPSQCARQIAPSPSLQTASCWGQIEHSEQWDGAQRPLVEAEADVDSDQLQMKPLSAIYPAATTVDSYALLKKKQHHGVIQDWGSIAHSPSVSCGSRTYPGQRNGSNINTIKRSSTKRTGSTYLGLGGTKKISALGASGKRSSKSCRGQHHHDSHKKTPIARPTHIHQEDCGNKKPLNNLAAAMAIAFSSSDRRRDSAAGAGVSVSAIRNIYRARHKQQEARQQQERERGQALNEIHQTWKVRTLSNSSHLRVSDKKFHGAEVVQGCLIDQPSSGPSSNEVLSDEHKRHREGGGERGYGVASNSDRSVEYDTRPTRTYTATALAYPQIFRDTPKEHCCLFDNLNWREVLQNDSYRVSLVRDIRQLLRAGRTVQVRARGAEGPSFSGSVEERSGWKDCQLMLRNMYMQAVQVNHRRGRHVL